jgi:antitoxin MazE
MQTRIQKWGNSLAVRIPRNVVAATGVSPDTEVEIWAEGETIMLKPVSRSKLTLDELLADVTPENTHGEVDWGNPAGQEVW